MSLSRLGWIADGDPEILARTWHRWRQQKQARRCNPFAATDASMLAQRIRAGSRPMRDAALPEPPGSILRFARVEATGEVVAQVNLHAINAMMKNAEIGYQVDEAHQGRGYATEMVRSFIDDVFRETDLRKLIAYVAEENVASRRVLEKLGFQAEGLLREHYLIEGRPVNEVVFGRLRREWVRTG